MIVNIKNRIKKFFCREQCCQRCEGAGEVPATWPLLKLHLQGMMSCMIASNTRFCAMHQIYGRWRDTGKIPCPHCGGEK